MNSPILYSDLRNRLEDLQRKESTSVVNEVYKDIHDGHLYKDNKFFKEKRGTKLGIILFQDEFQATSPLGSTNKLYKYLSTYITLAEFSPHLRLDLNVIKQVSVLSAADVEEVGYKKCFEPIINDIKDLESKGLEIGNTKYQVGLLMVVGDNLGQHDIGGFLKSFGSNVSYTCRYCLIEGKNVASGKYDQIKGDARMWRTCKRYDETIQALKSKNDKTDSMYGIKYECAYNKLESFHCCSPALPPCVSHDLLQGVVQYDLKLIINYFIENKFFSLRELNKEIRNFSFLGNDALSKPNKITYKKLQQTKIGGQAAETWTLLRFLPILIGKFITDKKNAIWKLLISLRELVTICTKHSISKDQIAYLNECAKKYLCKRLELFPDVPLKPKHHYLCHYAQLFYYFGPLIKVSTFRFESKHQFAKQCFIKKQNYINPTKMVLIHSQLHDLYYSSGSKSLQNYSYENPINVDSPAADVNFTNASILNRFNDRKYLYTIKKLMYNKLEYKIGQLLILDEDEDTFGRIVQIIVENRPQTVPKFYFILKKIHFALDEDWGLSFEEENEDISSENQFCVIENKEIILDFPLEAYSYDGKLYYITK